MWNEVFLLLLTKTCVFNCRWLIAGWVIHSNVYFYDQNSFWPSNLLAAIHHTDSLCSCSRWSDMCRWHMNGTEYIFDRLFLLADAMIWSNFDTGIQDGHRPPFWISWIFTFSTYMHVIHEIGLIFMLQSHFYIILVITYYYMFLIWPLNSRWPPYAMLNFTIYFSRQDYGVIVMGNSNWVSIFPHLQRINTKRICVHVNTQNPANSFEW